MCPSDGANGQNQGSVEEPVPCIYVRFQVQAFWALWEPPHPISTSQRVTVKSIHQLVLHFASGRGKIPSLNVTDRNVIPGHDGFLCHESHPNTKNLGFGQGNSFKTNPETPLPPALLVAGGASVTSGEESGRYPSLPVSVVMVMNLRTLQGSPPIPAAVAATVDWGKGDRSQSQVSLRVQASDFFPFSWKQNSSGTSWEEIRPTEFKGLIHS